MARARSAGDLAADGRLRAIRVYHSLWPLTGGHAMRPPLLPGDPSIKCYQRGASGRLAAARIYDDVMPPQSSDSSVQEA